MSLAPTARSGPDFKRQKIRKGTFSCWECKNRKIRCEYQSPAESACKSCQRRNVQCVSQEYVEVKPNDYGHVGERIENVEAMVNSYLKTKRKAPSSSFGQHSQIAKSATSSDEARFRIDSSSSFVVSASQQSLNECFSLSHHLHSILPTRTISMMIFTQANYFQTPVNLLRWPKKQPTSQDKPESLLIQFSKKPPPTAHPIIFAQKLYRLALCLQRIDPTTLYETKQNFKESVDDASRRFAEIASNHVTCHDMLVNSLEGLETLMLESSYLFSVGDHRGAWLTIRRALGLAELMGLRKKKVVDDDAGETVWYLLNYCDRFFSAMLGLPCNGFDNSFAAEPILAEKPLAERLARTHVAIIGRIIARNLQMQSYDNSGLAYDALDENYNKTQNIDSDLKQAATILPMDSWVVPNLRSSAGDKDVMEKTSMLTVQMHHYYLLLLLHQPYLLRLLHSKRTTGMNDKVDYTYSKLNALSASRDLLSRFVVMRDVHHSTSYRGVDNKAWIASVTLLLAHIDSQQSAYNINLLAHQRPQDLAIVHRLIQRLDLDVSANESTQQLRTLLQIEGKAFKGAKYYFTWGEEGSSATNGETIQLSIPYFGTISVLSSRLEVPGTYNDSAALPEIEAPAPRVTELRGSDFFNPTPCDVPVHELPDSFDIQHPKAYDCSVTTSDDVTDTEPTPPLSLALSEYLSLPTGSVLTPSEDVDFQLNQNWDHP
jgi:Fungal Zn(2)-Cys(6) binuclear cluster domain